MTKIEQLKSTKTIDGLAKLLGYNSTKIFTYILYGLEEKKKYKQFVIPKKNGGIRQISAPILHLKQLQKNLSDLLYSCYEELYKEKKIRNVSYAFKKNCSIFENSKQHTNKRFVFNVDLQNFFDSINFGRIRGFFINDQNFKLDTKIATIIAHISCFEKKLPQGSPTSPIISNLIGNILDRHLIKLAKKTKCTYTRYADDLTFSTNVKIFPKEIAFFDNTTNTWNVGTELNTVIEENGFQINKSKTSMQYKNNRQSCVGLIVNKQVNVKREYYKKVKAMCNKLFYENKFLIDNKEGTALQLRGMLDFIFNIKYKTFKQNKKLSRDKFLNLGISKLYTNFIFFSCFIKRDKPLILTEGKTDIVYLKCSLKSLKNSFPELISYDEKKKQNKFKITIMKLPKILQSVSRISEGTGGLTEFIKEYSRFIEEYKFEKNKLPIIILVVDNDKAGKNVLKHYDDNKQKYEKVNIHVFGISPNNDIEVIEDLFFEDIRKTKIDGKILSTENNFDSNNFYGKNDFAQKVILPRWKNINFEKFKYIFNEIKKIVCL